MTVDIFDVAAQPEQDARLHLITALRAKQGDKTLEEFGGTFGTHKARLSMFYREQIHFGSSVLGALLVIYPDLAPQINAYLNDRGRLHLERSADVASILDLSA